MFRNAEPETVHHRSLSEAELHADASARAAATRARQSPSQCITGWRLLRFPLAMTGIRADDSSRNHPIALAQLLLAGASRLGDHVQHLVTGDGRIEPGMDGFAIPDGLPELRV